MDHKTLTSVLRYDPEDGAFTWLVTRGSVSAGKRAFGTPQGSGYTQVRVFGHLHLAHRLAWFYMTGAWPENEVDHRNGVRSDNRWGNLRDVDPSTNMENEQRARAGRKYSTLMGAFYRKDTGRWFSHIYLKKRCIRLGQFETEQEAHAAYMAAKRRLHAGCTI